MSSTKPLGVVLLVLSLPLLLGAIVYLFMTDPPLPAFVSDDLAKTGTAVGGAGVGFLFLGVILLVVSPKKKVAPVVVVPPPAQTYEIKRTAMDVGSSSRQTVGDELQTQLDLVNQKMGRLKVQFGMGELSNESYKTLMGQYEVEKAAVERRILESQGR